MATNLVGRTIGKYEIVELIGRGGMAEVYKAYHSGLDRHVAVKVMHSFLADDKEFATRFQREARVVANMRHTNVVQVHDFDIEEGMPYMVMEYIEGEALKDRLVDLQERGEWLPLDEAVRITLAVGSALKYAHRLGMVHRDVKPANVMINREGQVILTDFGIAKILHGSGATQLTASGAMVGTPAYMAPEQGRGEPGDARSDIYSLGVMLYQLATGRLPYEADTPLAMAIKHINEPLPGPRSINPNLSLAVEGVILRALAKNTAERYQDVGDLMADLKRAMGMALDDTPAGLMQTWVPPAAPAPLETRTPPTPPPAVPAVTGSLEATRVAEAPRRVRLRAALVALVALFVIVAGGSGFLIWSASRQSALEPTQAPSPTVAITPSATSTPAPTGTPRPAVVKVKVSEENVELHAEPAEGQVLGLLPQGIELTVSARTDDSAWVKVEAAGTSGWVRAEALGLEAPSIEHVPTPIMLIVPTSTPDVTQTWVACKPVAELAEHVTVPEGARIEASQEFTKTWRIENAGNCAFDEGSSLVHKSGDKLGGKDTLEVSPIEAGETMDVSIGMVAPHLGGSYSGAWEFRRADGSPMGVITVSIVVIGPTATRPPTFTPRPTLPPTVRPTATPDRSLPGPVGSGEFTAVWPGNLFNCTSFEKEDTDGNTYWEWEADFAIEVRGGTAGYTISASECRWDFGQQKFICRWGSRADGQVLKTLTVSCPTCTPISVMIQARAKIRGGGTCEQTWD